MVSVQRYGMFKVQPVPGGAVESRGIINRAGRLTVLHREMKTSVPRGVIDVESYHRADRGRSVHKMGNIKTEPRSW